MAKNANARKTVNVKSIVETLHANIARAKTVEAKMAFCTAIEQILLETDNYRGFGYTFYDAEAYRTYGSVNAAIESGLGTEYDRVYY